MTAQRFKALTAVHLFLIRDDRQVLLSRRFQTGYEDGKYSVIAGHLEGNEEVRMAMRREAQEEAGIEILPEDLTVVGVIHRKANDERIDFFLVANRWRGEVTNAEPHKCDALAWFALDALPETMIPCIKPVCKTLGRNFRKKKGRVTSVNHLVDGRLACGSHQETHLVSFQELVKRPGLMMFSEAKLCTKRISLIAYDKRLPVPFIYSTLTTVALV